jgi:hypothetical protein
LKLSKFTEISELVAAVLVVVSLVLIYQELEQNTKSTQDASYQQFLGNLTELDLAEAADGELSRISALADKDPAALSSEEWNRYTRLAAPRIAQLEYAYLSRLNGTMSDLHWQAVEPHLQYLLCLPGNRKFMDSGMDQIYADAFLSFLNEEIYPNCNDV